MTNKTEELLNSIERQSSALEPQAQRIVVKLIRLVRAQREALDKKNEAIKTLFDLMDEGHLVRDTSKDHLPDWTMKALKLTMALKKSYEALALSVEDLE